MTTDGVGAAASNQYLGQYSGVSSQTIDQLIQADSIPMNLLQNQVQDLQGQEQAWSDVRSRLTNFLNDVQDLQKSDTYNSKVANSTNTSVATISGDDTASEGSHDIIVKQLATASKWTGGRVNSVPDSKTALNITGNFTIDLAAQADAPTGTDGEPINVPGFTIGDSKATSSKVSVDIKPGDTLNSIVTQINAQTKDTDIQASIVDNHLVFTSTQTGKAAFSVDSSSTAGIADQLGLGTPQAATNQGQSALFSLDGLPIARNTNNVTDVLDGATITLAGVSATSGTGADATATPTTLSLADDTSKFQGAVSKMVDQYNSLMGLISSDLDPGDPTKADNQTGALVGDATLTQLQESLENMVTESVTGGNPASPDKTSDSVGISFVDKNGTLGLDTDKFSKALKADPQAVKDFFYSADTDAKTGIVSNERGYATDLAKLTNSYLVNSTGNQGIIALTTAGFDSTIQDLNTQISNFQDQLTAKRAEYVTQFSALDSFMAQAQSQMTYFSSQIGAGI